MDWKLADAKNKFSEVVKRALRDGPQRVKRRDEAVIILSERDYERLTGTRPSFRDFLLGAPDMAGVDLTRDPSPVRDVDL